MTDHKSLISKISKNLPELVSSKDLVKIGMYKSEQGAYVARRTGECPPYVRIPSCGIRYPKLGVINFLTKLLLSETPFANASISHSNVPTLRQKQKDMAR